jgi:hypothetical protein
MNTDDQQKASEDSQQKALARSFIPGERGMTGDCVGFGRGGGFMQSYSDLIIYPDGKMEEISFSLPSAPDNYVRAPKGKLDAFHFENILSILDQASFYRTIPDQSSTLASYIFVSRPAAGVHVVEWSASRPAHPQNPVLGTLHLLLNSLPS